MKSYGETTAYLRARLRRDHPEIAAARLAQERPESGEYPYSPGRGGRGLEHFHAAGVALNRAKDACPHGQWMTWVKKHLRFDQRRANRYMALAKLDVTSNLEGEWQAISGNSTEDVQNGAAPPAEYLILEQWNALSKARRAETLRVVGDSPARQAVVTTKVPNWKKGTKAPARLPRPAGRCDPE